MNKVFFIIALIIYVLSSLISKIFNLETHNTVWAAILLFAFYLPLCIGCVINSAIYRKKDSAWRFLFYYFSFMCSFAILLIAILTSIILKNINDCIIILIIYFVLSIVAIIGYFVCKKLKNNYKYIFGFFIILFLVSFIVNMILTIILVM